MKPNEPHSFQPRNPDDAEGRVTCAYCPLDANAHLLGNLRASIGLCLTKGCPNKAQSKGMCRGCLGRRVVLSAAVRTEVAALVDRARGPSLSRSAWIRGAILRALTVEVPPEDSTTKDPEHFP